MIDFECPHCTRMLRISEDHLGAEGACRYCGGRILVRPGVKQPPEVNQSPDDWNGMLAEVPQTDPTTEKERTVANANGPTPEKPEASVLARPDYLETNLTILQTLLTQSRSDVERLARELELARNARIESDVARDIAEARAKRMEERLVAESARTDFNVLAADLERAITQLAQSRAEVERLAKDLEVERSAKIRAEITGRLLESHLKRLQHDIDPNQDEFVNTIAEVSAEASAEISAEMLNAEAKMFSKPLEEHKMGVNTLTLMPEVNADLPLNEANPPITSVKSPTLNLGKIRPEPHRRSPVFTVLLVILLSVLSALAAITYVPQFQGVRDGLLAKFRAETVTETPIQEITPSVAPGSQSSQSETTPAPVEPVTPTPEKVTINENINGMVRDAETGAAMGNVDLRITGEAAGAEGIDLRSAQDGSFTLLGSQLGYGSLTIECMTPPEGYAPSSPYPAVRQKDQSTPPVEIKLAKKNPAEATASPIKLSGRVLTAKGQPAPGFSVWASVDGETAKIVTKTNADGAYEFACASGTVNLCAAGLGTVQSEVAELKLSPSEQTVTHDLTLAVSGRIVVKLKGLDGEIKDKVEVCTLKYLDNIAASPELMQIDGKTLVVPYLVPGKYDLGFTIAGHRSVYKPNIIVPADGSDVEVEATLTVEKP